MLLSELIAKLEALLEEHDDLMVCTENCSFGSGSVLPVEDAIRRDGIRYAGIDPDIIIV